MRLTKKDIIYNKLTVAMEDFVKEPESLMIINIAIKEYEKKYPSYYKTNFLKQQLEKSLVSVCEDRMDI